MQQTQQGPSTVCAYVLAIRTVCACYLCSIPLFFDTLADTSKCLDRRDTQHGGLVSIIEDYLNLMRVWSASHGNCR